MVYLREARSLPDQTRHEMADLQNQLLDTLAQLLRAGAPALTTRHGRIVALGAIAAINGTIGMKPDVQPEGWLSWSTAAATAVVAAAI